MKIDYRQGIMCHYLSAPASTINKQNPSISDWNKQIDAFDEKNSQCSYQAAELITSF